MTRSFWISLACALVALLLAGWYWPDLPQPMPVHWSGGQPDGFMPTLYGVLLLPGLIVVVAILLHGVRLIDPRQEHMARSWPAIATILVSTSCLLLAVQWLMLRASVHPDLALDERVVFVLIGLFWIVLGNVMPKLRSNWFAGIRTPWTLASDKVWHLTHRVAGWSFALAGLVTALVSGLAPAPWLALLTLPLLIGAAIVPIVYSYVAWRRLDDASGTPT